MTVCFTPASGHQPRVYEYTPSAQIALIAARHDKLGGAFPFEVSGLRQLFFPPPTASARNPCGTRRSRAVDARSPLWASRREARIIAG